MNKNKTDDGWIMKLLDIPLYCLSYLVDRNQERFEVSLAKKILVFIACILIIIQVICVAAKLLLQP